MTTNRYIVMSASANMPSSCWGKYGRVAVVELEEGWTSRPAMISDRARGIRRVVKTWERLNIGTTERCAFARAVTDAAELAARLNSTGA